MLDVIDRVMAEQRRVGETVQPPASESAIAAERETLLARFAAELPEDYAALLSSVNGVDFNGVVLYGVGQSQAEPGPGGFWQGLAEANGLWREAPGHEGCLVLGETDMDLLTVDLDGGRPALRDKVSRDVCGSFASVGEAIAGILGSRL